MNETSNDCTCGCESAPTPAPVKPEPEFTVRCPRCGRKGPCEDSCARGIRTAPEPCKCRDVHLTAENATLRQSLAEAEGEVKRLQGLIVA
jgi:hypothetical protein